MDLSLEFGNGRITGEGRDRVGQFIVSGRYDSGGGECHWTKTYVSSHDIYYVGCHQGKNISGTWELDSLRGGFKIWPVGSGTDEDDVKAEALEEPVDAVGVVIQ